jgi:helix-turn-helix protein
MTRGFTVADVAARFRVSPDKVRGWIRRGELAAVNTSTLLCGRPRFVVTPEALAQFEAARSPALPPKRERRKRLPPGYVDYFPDLP